jgi:hypothetical protein
MTILTIPPGYGGYGSPATLFGQLEAKPDFHNYEEMHVSHNTNHQNLSQCLLSTSRAENVDSSLRECERYTTTMDSSTWKTIRKKLVSKHLSCGMKTFGCVKGSKCRPRRVFTSNKKESSSLED